jgi:hypothetical protein
MFDTEVLLELLLVVVVWHTPLTHVITLQPVLSHTVFVVVLCVRALADVDITIVNTSVSSPPVASNNLVVFI